MKTEQLTLEYLEQMTDPTKFKSFKVRLKDSALAKIKLRNTATYTVQSVQKPSKVFKNYQLHIGRNWYNAEMFRLVSEQEDDKRIDNLLNDLDKALDQASTEYCDYLIKSGIIKIKSQQPTQPDHSVTDQFQPEPIHPDNQIVKTLVQYVSDHREAMSKDSIRHFANLIGLIKLGAL